MISAINRLYRYLFCRGGHGVHSPFVFDLITTVIEEKKSYYCYERLSAVRKKLQKNCDKIKYNNHEFAVNKYVKKFCFSEHDCRLLFRLANRFKPQTIYAQGSDMGLAPLYLTSWSERSDCVVFEPESSVAVVARNIVEKYSSASIEIHVADNPEFTGKSIDFIVWNKITVDTFNKLLPSMNDNSIMIISGINSSRKNRDTWKRICAAPRVTVTIDHYSLGIVFFNPKLHRKTYKN